MIDLKKTLHISSLDSLGGYILNGEEQTGAGSRQEGLVGFPKATVRNLQRGRAQRGHERNSCSGSVLNPSTGPNREQGQISQQPSCQFKSKSSPPTRLPLPPPRPTPPAPEVGSFLQSETRVPPPVWGAHRKNLSVLVRAIGCEIVKPSHSSSSSSSKPQSPSARTAREGGEVIPRGSSRWAGSSRLPSTSPPSWWPQTGHTRRRWGSPGTAGLEEDHDTKLTHLTVSH